MKRTVPRKKQSKKVKSRPDPTKQVAPLTARLAVKDGLLVFQDANGDSSDETVDSNLIAQLEKAAARPYTQIFKVTVSIVPNF